MEIGDVVQVAFDYGVDYTVVHVGQNIGGDITYYAVEADGSGVIVIKEDEIVEWT